LCNAYNININIQYSEAAPAIQAAHIAQAVRVSQETPVVQP